MPVHLSISTSDAQSQLASSMELTVTYENAGTDPVSFRDPERTWEVALFVRQPGNDEVAGQAPFGKLMFTRHGGLERRTVEDAREVTLAPRQRHTFSQDVGSRWPHLFPPGRWELSVVDRTETPYLESNRVALTVVFAKESVPKLLDLAEHSVGSSDPNAVSSEDTNAVSARQFAARWLHEVNPAFSLTVPSENPTTAAQNQRALTEMRSWWQQHGDSQAVLSRIVELNQRALQATP